MKNYLIYANKTFKEKKIKCEGLIDYLDFLGGHPDYSMQFLQKVYINSLAYGVKEVKEGDLNNFMIDTILDNRAYVNELISKAKSKKHHLDVLTALSRNEKSTLDGKSLYNVKTSLEDMGLIRNVSQGKYIIVDVFLNFVLAKGGFNELETTRKIVSLSSGGIQLD